MMVVKQKDCAECCSLASELSALAFRPSADHFDGDREEAELIKLRKRALIAKQLEAKMKRAQRHM